eukprot:GHVU01076890.1.p1 GENE.GHVU01076890.1~~GHVU01076890.1.p1  ORF type:complete len:137 (-),score=11.17 GHVU01076890.1:11-421(-)
MNTNVHVWLSPHQRVVVESEPVQRPRGGRMPRCRDWTRTDPPLSWLAGCTRVGRSVGEIYLGACESLSLCCSCVSSLQSQQRPQLGADLMPTTMLIIKLMRTTMLIIMLSRLYLLFLVTHYPNPARERERERERER